MDRRTACIAQAAACREMAEADPANQDYWVDQSIKWLERAAESCGQVAVSYDWSGDSVKVTRDKLS